MRDGRPTNHDVSNCRVGPAVAPRGSKTLVMKSDPSRPDVMRSGSWGGVLPPKRGSTPPRDPERITSGLEGSELWGNLRCVIGLLGFRALLDP